MNRLIAAGVALSIVLAAGAVVWNSQIKSTAPVVELGPMLGYVGPDEARIWLKASRPASAGALVSRNPDFHEARTVSGPDLVSDSGQMGVIRIKDLQPSTRYFYRITLGGVAEAGKPHSFVTSPEEGATGRFRFAVVSCIGEVESFLGMYWSGKSVSEAWSALAEVPLDLVLQVGDNVYAASTEPEVQRRMYRRHRELPSYRRVSSITPTLAIWDDWDFAGNDSDGLSSGKKLSLRSFKELWANPSYGQADDPGIYFKFSRGDVDVFMLDGRYHRSPNDTVDDGSKTMLGQRQLSWLKRELSASRATLKFLVSGSQWTNSGKSDSWRSFKRERNELFDYIRDQGIDGVILLSGDRHLSAGYQVDGRIIEISSSPFAAESHAPPEPPAEMFMLNDQGRYFVVVDAETNTFPPSLTIEMHRVGDGMVRRRQFSWDEINGKSQIPPCETAAACRQ